MSNLYRTERCISFSDLMVDKGFQEAFSKGGIDKYLWACGIDVTEGVEEVFVEHRNLQGKVVKCLLFQGLERQDSEWFNSGLASIENQIEIKNDPSYRAELKIMNKYPSFSEFLIKEVEEGNKKERKE